MALLDRFYQQVESYEQNRDEDRDVFNSQVKKLMQNEKHYKKKALEMERTYSLLQSEKSKFTLKQQKFEQVLKFKEQDLHNYK